VQAQTGYIAASVPVPSVLRKLSQDEQESLTRLVAEPVSFMDHPSFHKPRVARELFDLQLSSGRSAEPWCNSSHSKKYKPADTDLTMKKTLTTEQEQRLFLRYNYARFRAAKLLAKSAGRRLTAKAAKELLWWNEQILATRAAIVQANMPLVLAMAKRTRLGHFDHAELISEGNMALLRSVDKFDCGRGFKFSTYACRAILKSFSRVAMRTSRYRGRFPTEFDPSLEKSNYIEQCREEHKADCVDELRGMISSNAADLNDVEVKVIRARFALGKVAGIAEDGPKTLEQVGLLIGVTKERVRQIQNRALGKLRSKLLEDFLAA
jgi:RNA polymerase sigma factor (sigma-70 family)